MRNRKISIISVNPDLKTQWGHYFHYDQRIREALHQEGGELITLASKQGDPTLCKNESIYFKMKKIADYFPRLRWSKRLCLFRYAAGCIRFSRDITISLPKSNGSIYFMYLGSIVYLPAFLLHALTSGFRHRYVINLFGLHFTVGQHHKPPLKCAGRYLLNTTRQLLYRLKIFLCTDSQMLNAKLGVSFPILPMFSTTKYTETDLQASSEWYLRKDANPQLVVSLPGLAREGKGYDKANQMVNALLTKNPTHFYFKIRKLSHPNEEELTNCLPSLMGHGKIYDGVLTDEQYKELLIESDVIFISYRLKEFHTRTSAVLSDSILLRRPVVGPQCTWIGDIIETHHIGETFVDGNVKDMCNALWLVHENLSYYKMNIDKFSEQWLARNNVGTCLNFILSN